MSDKESIEKKSDIVISAEPLSPQDKAYLKFGEEILVKSAENIKDFAKTMITIITGLFAAYFAILEFLGVKDITIEKAQLLNNLIGLPPILFILSILAFVFTILPLYGKITLNSLDSIKRIRNSSVLTKLTTAIIGIALFLIGMSLMLLVNISLLQL